MTRRLATLDRERVANAADAADVAAGRPITLTLTVRADDAGQVLQVIMFQDYKGFSGTSGVDASAGCTSMSIARMPSRTISWSSTNITLSGGFFEGTDDILAARAAGNHKRGLGLAAVGG